MNRLHFQGKDRPPKRNSFTLVPNPINRDVLRTFGGEEIAEHCRDVNSHWILPRDETGMIPFIAAHMYEVFQ